VVELGAHNLVLLDRDYQISAKSAIGDGAPRGETLTALIEKGLRLELAHAKPGRRRPKVAIPVFRGGKGLLPGVDLNNSAGLLDIMEGVK
jgi:hypothetical protein